MSDIAEDAIQTEEFLIRNNIDNHLCINLHYGGCKHTELLSKSHRGRNYESLRKSMLTIGPDGLNIYQRSGKKILGENNPAKRSGKQISEGRKKYTRKNPEKVAEDNKKINQLLDSVVDENGLTARNRHSIWMLENNPTTNTIWVNNGQKNLRIKQGTEVPPGYSIGRLMKKQGLTSCPHCDKMGAKGNMIRYHFDKCKEYSNEI